MYGTVGERYESHTKSWPKHWKNCLEAVGGCVDSKSQVIVSEVFLTQKQRKYYLEQLCFNHFQLTVHWSCNNVTSLNELRMLVKISSDCQLRYIKTAQIGFEIFSITEYVPGRICLFIIMYHVVEQSPSTITNKFLMWILSWNLKVPAHYTRSIFGNAWSKFTSYYHENRIFLAWTRLPQDSDNRDICPSFRFLSALLCGLMKWSVTWEIYVTLTRSGLLAWIGRSGFWPEFLVLVFLPGLCDLVFWVVWSSGLNCAIWSSGLDWVIWSSGINWLIWSSGLDYAMWSSGLDCVI